MDDATSSSTPRATTRYTSETYALSGKIMLSAIVILFTVVLLILCLHIYARCYLSRSRRRNRHSSRRARIIFAADLSPTAAPSRGLDPSVLTSLPAFPFSSAAHPDGLECAVCLSEFQDGDKARLLPKCGHSFHVECIDMWFHSHDTCPLCRVPVGVDFGVIGHPCAASGDDHVVEIVVDSANGELGGQMGCSCDSDRANASCSSSGSSVGARRKALGFMGMSIEVPRRNESFKGVSIDEEIGNGSPGNQGFRTPGGRILSFKRILGRERRASSSTPLSCRSGAETVMDVERGIRGEDREEEEREREPRRQALTPSGVKA